jgi:ABC-type uncharacterized transport system substrate-binding protein
MSSSAWKCHLLGACAAVLCLAGLPALATDAEGPKRYKVLHVMSYHSPWRWTDGQLSGFKDAMAGLPTEYRVFQMDTKRNSTPEAKEKMGADARKIIDDWRPDLVFATDDDAQQYVAKHYVGHDIPFVFSGVNAAPANYGFAGSRNVTGVLEQEHFVESVRLLKNIVPGVRRIAAVFDDAAMWQPVIARMKERLNQIPEVEFVAWDTIHDFKEYKSKIMTYHGRADAVALLGIFNFKDEQGRNVPYQEVLKWTAANSRLPDFSFWLDRAHYGTLCTVTVSEREQGLAAGRMARAILAEGKKPSELPMVPTLKGIPVISLARANALGLKLSSSLLLSAEIITKFEWEK